MDFVRYAERAAELVNARLDGADARALGDFQRALRAVFEASNNHAEQAVVARLNELLAQHPVSPHISGHDGSAWHLHVSEATSGAEVVIAESLMGLALLVCDLGANRLGVCDATPCTNVFVDTSPNQSRRYCSERCSSRANVAAYRARQRSLVEEGAQRPSRNHSTKANT